MASNRPARKAQAIKERLSNTKRFSEMLRQVQYPRADVSSKIGAAELQAGAPFGGQEGKRGLMTSFLCNQAEVWAKAEAAAASIPGVERGQVTDLLGQALAKIAPIGPRFDSDEKFLRFMATVLKRDAIDASKAARAACRDIKRRVPLDEQSVGTPMDPCAQDAGGQEERNDDFIGELEVWLDGPMIDEQELQRTVDVLEALTDLEKEVVKLRTNGLEWNRIEMVLETTNASRTYATALIKLRRSIPKLKSDRSER